MWKKIFMTLGVIGILGVAGCSNEVLNENDYSLCNATSRNNMAETKDGFVYAYNGFLYYADKENLNTWVPVCNKPDCKHSDEEIHEDCHAYLPSYNQIVQKDGKLYGMDMKDGTLWVYEMPLDGSGYKNVYEIPVETDGSSRIINCAYAISQNQFIVRYTYLDEKGMKQVRLGRLDDTSFEVLYSTEENDAIGAMSAKVQASIRGEDAYLLGLPVETGENEMNVLWTVEGDTFERVNLPEQMLLSELVGSYISEDKLTYFIQNEGFYEYDLNTKEKILICENNLENSKSYIMTDDYMVEYNRYAKYSPEDASLRVYNGNEWIEVGIPNEIKDSDAGFSPIAIASDRMFFSHSVNGVPHLYYYLFEKENPTLIASGVIGAIMEENESHETSTEHNNDEIEVGLENEIIIFDNEYCVLKAIDTYIENGEYVVNTSLKLKGDWKMGEKRLRYNVNLDAITINGIEFDQAYPYGELLQIQEEIEEKEYPIAFRTSLLEASGISDLYTIADYTDIAFSYSLKDNESGKIIETNSFHIYPKGEENVIHYEREIQPTDTILVNNEEISIIAIHYEQNAIPDDTVTLLIQNKTEEGMVLVVDTASINGVAPNRTIGGDELDNFFVSAGSYSFRTVSYFEPEFLEEKEIMDTGVIELLIRAHQCDASEQFSLSKLGEPIMNEHLTLYPKGEQNAIYYEREVKSTDKILIDNEYVTLVLKGFEDFVRGSDNKVENAIVKMYLVNKTNDIICMRAPESSFNGISCSNYIRGGIAFPQNKVFIDVMYNTVLLKELGITIGTEMEMLCEIANYESGSIGEMLVTEQVSLRPEE